MKRVDISSITQQQCEEILKVEVVKDHLDTAIVHKLVWAIRDKE